jgi:hypothetical protein
MDRMIARTEVIANISIIIVASLLSLVLVKNHLWVSSASSGLDHKASSKDSRLLGKKLSLPDIEWPKSRGTLLLALSSQCRFCTESAEFYQALLKKRTAELRVIAVMPQDLETSREYLTRLGLYVDEIRQASLVSIGVAGTPTILIVNEQGEVTDAWRGKLRPEGERDVLNRLQIVN